MTASEMTRESSDRCFICQPPSHLGIIIWAFNVELGPCSLLLRLAQALTQARPVRPLVSLPPAEHFCFTSRLPIHSLVQKLGLSSVCSLKSPPSRQSFRPPRPRTTNLILDLPLAEGPLPINPGTHSQTSPYPHPPLIQRNQSLELQR